MTVRTRKRMSLLLMLAAFAVIIGVIWHHSTDRHASTAAINEFAPDFDLKAIDGKAIRLSEYRGHKVILHFWATYCPPCVKEMPLFQRIMRQNAKVDVIGVNVGQSRGTVASFGKSNGLSFPLVIDATGTASDLYRIQALPTTVLVDERGRIARIITGAIDSESELSQWLKEIE